MFVMRACSVPGLMQETNLCRPSLGHWGGCWWGEAWNLGARKKTHPSLLSWLLPQSCLPPTYYSLPLIPHLAAPPGSIVSSLTGGTEARNPQLIRDPWEKSQTLSLKKIVTQKKKKKSLKRFNSTWMSEFPWYQLLQAGWILIVSQKKNQEMLSLITHIDHPISLLDHSKSSQDIAQSRGLRGEFSYTGCSWSAVKTTFATSLCTSGPSLEHVCQAGWKQGTHG